MKGIEFIRDMFYGCLVEGFPRDLLYLGYNNEKERHIFVGRKTINGAHIALARSIEDKKSTSLRHEDLTEAEEKYVLKILEGRYV